MYPDSTHEQAQRNVITRKVHISLINIGVVSRMNNNETTPEDPGTVKAMYLESSLHCP